MVPRVAGEHRLASPRLVRLGARQQPTERLAGRFVRAGLDNLPHPYRVEVLVDAPAAARPTFVALRALSEALRAKWSRLGAGLSMGMSDDFEVAVEEGATMVRLGTALFGPRR